MLEDQGPRPQCAGQAARAGAHDGDELRQAADVVADGSNAARGDGWSFLVPRKGWSPLDKEGRPIYDPQADVILRRTVKERLDEGREGALICTCTRPSSRAAVDEFVRLFVASQAARREPSSVEAAP